MASRRNYHQGRRTSRQRTDDCLGHNAADWLATRKNGATFAGAAIITLAMAMTSSPRRAIAISFHFPLEPIAALYFSVPTTMLPRLTATLLAKAT